MSKKKKSRSGPTTPEHLRSKKQTKVRLSEGYEGRLDALVESGDWESRGDLIEAWIDCEEIEQSEGRRYARKAR